jgi:hypothetical protein
MSFDELVFLKGTGQLPRFVLERTSAFIKQGESMPIVVSDIYMTPHLL